MKQTKLTKLKMPTRFALYIRLSPDEYLRLAKESYMLGTTLQERVRHLCFSGAASQQSLFPVADKQEILIALSRIGNNVNQIARAMNCGIREGFNPNLDAMQSAFAQLIKMLTANTVEACAQSEQT